MREPGDLFNDSPHPPAPSPSGEGEPAMRGPESSGSPSPEGEGAGGWGESLNVPAEEAGGGVNARGRNNDNPLLHNAREHVRKGLLVGVAAHSGHFAIHAVGRFAGREQGIAIAHHHHKPLAVGQLGVEGVEVLEGH